MCWHSTQFLPDATVVFTAYSDKCVCMCVCVCQCVCVCWHSTPFLPDATVVFTAYSDKCVCMCVLVCVCECVCVSVCVCVYTSKLKSSEAQKRVLLEVMMGFTAYSENRVRVCMCVHVFLWVKAKDSVSCTDQNSCQLQYWFTLRILINMYVCVGVCVHKCVYM